MSRAEIAKRSLSIARKVFFDWFILVATSLARRPLEMLTNHELDARLLYDASVAKNPGACLLICDCVLG